MIKFPNAKINLGLNIVNRRPDGYHDIETVFYPINLQDAVEIVPAKGNETTLTTYGRKINCPVEKNLVMKAFRALEKDFNLPPVDIHLHKNIPDGAGLGGGSSDAASTLLILNEMFKLGIPTSDLAKRAARLGADCAFFIYNTPMKATGIGDILSPAEVRLQGKTLLLVKPDVSVPTAEAYSMVKPQKSETDIISILNSPVDTWHNTLKNDFETSVFAKHPELATIKAQIYEKGAIYASMSGSGSSIFGIFDCANMAEKAKNIFSRMNVYVINL
ncbi:MAG: 4-(cytidine 5'-diphospho)-2-C-methyl-D-erythritol kinase [Muribaculaceae bacterium]|nr:4-(cytidine 5'-diphospho)-2-C-methyl-D-erythritol kinase [Muribaculaceae bacterium]